MQQSPKRQRTIYSQFQSPKICLASFSFLFPMHSAFSSLPCTVSTHGYTYHSQKKLHRNFKILSPMLTHSKQLLKGFISCSAFHHLQGKFNQHYMLNNFLCNLIYINNSALKQISIKWFALLVSHNLFSKKKKKKGQKLLISCYISSQDFLPLLMRNS